jgi:hypothetical protein
MADLRWRRRAGVDVVVIEVDRQAVLDANLMTPSQYADPRERARVIGEWIDELLATRSFGVTP